MLISYIPHIPLELDGFGADLQRKGRKLLVFFLLVLLSALNVKFVFKTFMVEFEFVKSVLL